MGLCAPLVPALAPGSVAPCSALSRVMTRCAGAYGALDRASARRPVSDKGEGGRWGLWRPLWVHVQVLGAVVCELELGPELGHGQPGPEPPA